MSDEAKVRELFGPSLERQVDVEGHKFKVDRERAVASIQSAGAKFQAARAHRLWGLGIASVLAAAAAAALFLGSAPPVPVAQAGLAVEGVRGSVTRLSAGASVVVVAGAAGATIPVASELRTAAGSAVRVRSRQGLSIEVFENSRLALGGLEPQPSTSVQLLAGSIRLQVPHLTETERFMVVTPDARVLVHGTVFSVLVSELAGQAKTCVKVEKGEVLVESATGTQLVGRAGTWGCEARVAAQVEPPSATPAPPVEPPLRAPKAREPGESKAPAGTLDAENRLFQAGLSAERRGDLRAATSAFQRLLSSYPASPLGADARAGLERVKRGAVP